MDQQVIDKIRKLLALSLDKSSVSESESAALLAQKLMAKHNIKSVNLEKSKADIGSISCSTGKGKAWKYSLANIIADNFRCKTFLYGHESIAFYGIEKDAIIASEVFQSLFLTGNKLSNREVYKVRKIGMSTVGIYNSFVYGFIKGIKLKLDQQSMALKIKIDESVEDEFKKFSKEFKHIERKKSIHLNDKAFKNGVECGKKAFKKDELL